MRRSAAILFNITGQLLELRFPNGRPTSATFSVLRAWADDDAAAEFSGTATVDAVNTTTNASAGPAQADPQRIPLTSTTGIVTTRKYLLSQNSISEWVQPVEIGASYIRVRHPLENDYTTGATFVSTTVTATVDPTWIADRSKISDLSDTYADYRVKWSVVYASATYTNYTFFDVVRASIAPEVDIDDINARAPGLHDSLPAEYRVEDGRPLVDAAWRAVQAHLQSVNIDPNALRDNQALDELVILRALRILAEGGWAPASLDKATYIEVTRDNYNVFFEQHFQVTLKHRIDMQLGSLSQVERTAAPSVFWRK